MTVFETKLGFLEFFLSALGSFYIIPISFFAFFSNNFGLYILGIIIIILGIIQFSFTLKTFHLNKDYLIIRRPMFFLSPTTKFKIAEIERIAFRQVRTKIGGGHYLIIFTNGTEKHFMLIYSGEVLKYFISKLKETGIKTTLEFKIA